MRELRIRIVFFTLTLVTLCESAACAPVSNKNLVSFDTGHTITNVRTASGEGGEYVVASTYEGALLGYSFDGKKLWENALSGFMNHDIWCDDVTGDGIDECFAANADGHLYAVDAKGKTLWSFSRNEVPFMATTVVKGKGGVYVVAGSFDKNIYYLDAKGGLVKKLDSSTYGIEKTHAQAGKAFPKPNYHVANFLRPLRQTDGTDYLFIHAINNHMRGNGTYYVFKPLADKPVKTIPGKTRVVGHVTVLEENGIASGNILIGNSNVIKNSVTGVLNMNTENETQYKFSNIGNKIDTFGYRVAQPFMIKDGGTEKRMVLFGSRMIFMTPSGEERPIDIWSTRHSYNDAWQDKSSGRIILASAQSGGSNIHVLDPSMEGWKQAYADLKPSGKIQRILNNSAELKDLVAKHKPSKADQTGRQVIFATEKQNGVKHIIKTLEETYGNPLFLGSLPLRTAEDYDRTFVTNEKYRNRRDRRRKYIGKTEDYLEIMRKRIQGTDGLATWGGHGNDPLMFSMETKKALIDEAKGKKFILIFPEMADPSDDFNYVMDNMIYPLAEYGQGKNFNFHARSKHAFWQADIYMPRWDRLISGEFADVFVPSMEETTDKSMELSLSGRMGVWLAGSVNQWAARSARDNPSMLRTRQHSHQMVPNHFLRQQVYAISSGATHLNNFTVDQKYMSVLWEMIGKGIVYAPERHQILSLNPVHLSMLEPDPLYLRDSQNVKWATFYDEDEQNNNPRVFSRLDGSWPGAQVTEWDFSRYAANETERRHNFIPEYPNGMVLMTPPQEGAENDPRGTLEEKLHPIYHGKLKEFKSDGRAYISTDGKTRYPANTYYTELADAIAKSADILPLTISGNVGWVVSEIEPTRLRLTVIDGGYLSPDDREAVVTFGASSPKAARDVLTGEVLEISKAGKMIVNVPTGLFRFIDIELERPLIDDLH